MDVREGSGEAGRQRGVLVLARRNEQSHGLEIEVRLAAELFGYGRENLVAHTQAQRELGSDLPVVLSVTGVPEFLRSDEVIGGHLTPINLAEQEGSHGVAGLPRAT